QQAQQKEDRRQEAVNSNQQLIERLENERQRQQKENEQAQRKKQQEATDRLLDQMTQQQREALEQRQRQEQQRQGPLASNTPPAPGPTASTPATAGSDPAGGTAFNGEVIRQLYEAYYRRPADAEGLAYW